ncbi:hypothetical protein ODS41_04180 [Pyrobaculum sp. 3827-6]|uniref:hypothetical protein n=1 Tax=Pyrobaculum sp. 3827-6 TaxID=2983604 RepID=UPI0021D9437C|nr:hypothetical protein [Pyrobaculum sp. 3827-6]MCU7787123.1 hypothetical protein [Pyrobaculum sp. 3827-6]
MPLERGVYRLARQPALLLRLKLAVRLGRRVRLLELRNEVESLSQPPFPLSRDL